MAPSASPADLQDAYGVCAHEALDVDPDYGPDTVNTDSWKATQGAWKSLVQEISLKTS